jgi:hypothetical protein
MTNARLSITKACLLLLPLVLTVAVGRAEVQLTTVIGNNAVLQRGMDVPIWGRAEPGEEVIVSFADQTKNTAADRFGRWRVELAPMSAESAGRTLVVAGPHNSIQCENVMVGDVWLYLTQSFHLNEREGPHRAWEPPPESLPPISFCRRSDLFEVRSHSDRPQEEFYAGDGRNGQWNVYRRPANTLPIMPFRSAWAWAAKRVCPSA